MSRTSLNKDTGGTYYQLLVQSIICSCTIREAFKNVLADFVRYFLNFLNRYGIFFMVRGESSCPGGSEYVWQRGVGGL